MRKLNGGDAFAFLRVIRISGARESMAEIFKQVKGGKFDKENDAQREAGLNFILELMCNCATDEAEDAIWRFLSGPLEETPAELKNRPLDELTGLIEEMVEDNVKSGNLAGFFRSVGKLVRTETQASTTSSSKGTAPLTK